MALINCPECGKEISDKAASCPHCGNPINQPTNRPIATSTPTNEDLMKCPKCNSTQLTSNQKGFSGGKAAAGAILAGGIGLLAGTIGSSNVIITCLRCGHKFKAGDYANEKYKCDETRERDIELAKKIAKGEQSFVGTILFFIIISIIGLIITFKLFINDWNFLGCIFGIVTLVCFGLAILFGHSEATRKPQ